MQLFPLLTEKKGDSFMEKLKKIVHPHLLFFVAVLFSILTFTLLQPFGDPPDEVNRFKVAQFICNYGKLPTGEEFEVAIGGYGGSYAFQPILPYMIQGMLMRLLSPFTTDNLTLLLCARLVNVLFGVIMAVYVRKLASLLFSDEITGWLFCLLIMFLPQNLFLHSYVNTDSMASMAGAIILYASVSGWKSHWRFSDCITLCIGIICCALSYYNAYGLIVTAILIFVFSHLESQDGQKLSFNWKPLLKRGLFISAIVLLGIGWWFLRNYVIHNGDFLGLKARTENAIRTALPQYNPATRVTVAGSGVSLSDMLLHTDFFYFLWNSFVARFGPMTIPTLPFLYIWYYRIYWFGWIFCLIPFRYIRKPSSHPKAPSYSPDLKQHSPRYETISRSLFHIAMLIPVLITMGLCIYYSYTSDYQPQGRYIMPMLIPFMYFITLGFHNLAAFLEKIFGLWENNTLTDFIRKWCRPLMMGGTILFLAGGLLLTLFCVVIPHYTTQPNLWNSPWISL